MYQTEYHEERRRQVAVNNSYICYSLRQGPVRVLNKLSAARSSGLLSCFPRAPPESLISADHTVLVAPNIQGSSQSSHKGRD